jgi:hypothetical protein
MLEMILELIAKYPMASAVFVVIGVLRAVFKPVFMLAQAYVDATPSKNDDAILGKVRESKIVKGLEFVLDYLASIKLPK